MERENFKEYSEAPIVEKEELDAMKTCFEELLTFLSVGGRAIFRFLKIKQAECKRISKQPRDFTGKRNYIFRWEFMLILIGD